MNHADFLDSFEQVPGGGLVARRVARQWERAQQCATWARESLHRETMAATACPLFPNEFVTPHERGEFVMRALAVGAAGEELQAIATHPGTHAGMRRHAAHLARWCMTAFLNLFVGHQRTLKSPPEYRVVSSGPLAVVWVSAGCVRWELNQFDLVGVDGDLSLLADIPAHIDTPDKLARWTHHRLPAESGAFAIAYGVTDEPTPPGVGGKDARGLSRA